MTSATEIEGRADGAGHRRGVRRIDAARVAGRPRRHRAGAPGQDLAAQQHASGKSRTWRRTSAPAAGKAIAAARAELEAEIAKRRASLTADARAASLVHDRIDLTTGGRGYRRGHLHPVTRIWRELEDVFVGMGYKVAEGPEVEADWYNFESLNFPPGHPARAMQDTLYVKLGRARRSVAAHAHVPGAGAHDGSAEAADLRRRAGPRVSQRDARRAPLAGVPSDRGPRGRPRASRSAICSARSRRSSTRCSGPTSRRASIRRSSRSPSRRPSSR